MNKELMATAMLGRDAEDFIGSDVGRYLLGCAEQEKEEALAALSKVLPWRRKKIQELQNKIWRADSFLQWVSELIITGRQAIQTMDEKEE